MQKLAFVFRCVYLCIFIGLPFFNFSGMKLLSTLIISLVLILPASAQTGITTALDFTVKDVKGNQHHLFDYLDEGKLVVIDFFTTNCGPCQTYASEVSASYEYYGCNYSNVVYLGINWGSDNASVIQFDELWGAHYPSVSGLQGNGNAVVDMYQVMSYPTVILIAPDRSILNNHIWPPDQANLNAQVDAAGGIPLICTVDVSYFKSNQSPALQASAVQHGLTEIQISDFKPGAVLQIFTSEGRLVSSNNLSSHRINFAGKPGIYIALLNQGTAKPETLRFLVY